MKQPAISFIILFWIFLSLFIFPINVHSIDATLNLNGFEKGEGGGGPAECDGKYHSDDDPIVALSTQWYNNGQRCFKYININYQDNSVQAMVVDECDSNAGCKDDIVDASRAVWSALQVPKSLYGEVGVTWSDA
ncbi:putative ripening-related protein 6 [Rutidosis leptorrhynchoides]|uniref:putative ripening-related protein 6 n=1 Tax=Rutidosis leptorrhynchoides TaxID=125765 RepID=UPI003A99D874